MSRERGAPPNFVQVGRSPSWHPEGDAFAFLKEDGIYLYHIQDGTLLKLFTTTSSYDLTFSLDGNYIVFCTQDEKGTRLNRLDVSNGGVDVLLQSPARMESPAWSPSGETVLFCWNRTGNRDIWALDVTKKTTHQLTLNHAADTDPIWDAERKRILFVSDRGRGLEFSTLYWLPVPEDLQ